MLRKVLLLTLITLSFILSGCGDDAKSLVRSGIEDKSGVKISEVYNKKKDDEKSKFAKEVTIAYFEQAKVDMAQKFKPDFHHYKLDDSIGDLLSHIDSSDTNFMNLRKLHQLFQRRRTDGDKIVALHRQLGLGSNRGDLRYVNAGPIRRYTLYIAHKVLSGEYSPLYAAVEAQNIGNEYTGRMLMPTANYVAVVHIPYEGVFAEGQGLYSFDAAEAGSYKFTDAGGFERNLPLLQLIPDGQVGAVRQFINLHKTRVDMEDILIPQFINNVLAEPGGEFQTGVASIDNQKPTIGNNSNSVSSSNSATAGKATASSPIQKNSKKVTLSAEEKRKLDVFFSNFAETWGENMPRFAFDGISNAELIQFGVAHNVINRKQVVKTINGKQAVPVGEVSFATKKYFGKDIQPQNTGNIECDGTYFYAVRADRNADCVARVKELYDNQDGTYTASYYSTLPSTDGRDYTATLIISPTDSSRYIFKENR